MTQRNAPTRSPEATSCSTPIAPCGARGFVAPKYASKNLPLTLESDHASRRRKTSIIVARHIMANTGAPKQLLHLVLGGELSSLDEVEFRDLDKVEIVGLFPSYATAYTAWKAKAQGTVDNAHMRYFIVHLHRLLDPETDVTRARA
jgi:uncharacterized protein DUF4170